MTVEGTTLDKLNSVGIRDLLIRSELESTLIVSLDKHVILNKTLGNQMIETDPRNFNNSSPFVWPDLSTRVSYSGLI